MSLSHLTKVQYRKNTSCPRVRITLAMVLNSHKRIDAALMLELNGDQWLTPSIPIAYLLTINSGDLIMPMNVIQGAPIPNHFGHAGGGNRTDAQAAINAIQYADIFGGARTIANHGTMRVDNQGHFQVGGAGPYYYNIQVQVNGVNGNSTVAHANVCDTIMTNDPLNQTGSKNRVISALQQSLDDDHSYTVTGTSP